MCSMIVKEKNEKNTNRIILLADSFLDIILSLTPL